MQHRIGYPIGGKILIQDQAPPPFHDVERRADDGSVLTQNVGLGRQRKARVESLEDVELARHVVGPRRDGPEWRPPEHGFPIPRAKQIRQVGVAGRELFDHELSRIEPGQASSNQEFADLRS